MDISAFPQHDSVTEALAGQNALIQQLQGENADLKQQLAVYEENFGDMAVGSFDRMVEGAIALQDHYKAQLTTAHAEVERLRMALEVCNAYCDARLHLEDTPKNLDARTTAALLNVSQIVSHALTTTETDKDIKNKLASIHNRMENVTQGDVDAALEFTVDMSAGRIAKFRAFEKAVTDFTDGKINIPQLVAAFLALKEDV